MSEQEIVKEVLRLLLNYARREALGGGKGHYVMLQLEKENSSFAKQLRRIVKNEIRTKL